MNMIKRIFGQKQKARKVGVVIAIPSLSTRIEGQMGVALAKAGYLSHDPKHPFYYEPIYLEDCQPVDVARNQMVKKFMDDYPKSTWLMFWDEDGTPPMNFWELIGHADITAGITWMWRPEQKPLGRLLFNHFLMNPKDGEQFHTPIAPPSDRDPYRIDAVGMHCTVIHRKVFERLGPAPFEIHHRGDGSRFEGEDVDFCRKARTQGFTIMGIPTVVFDHHKRVSLRQMWETIVAKAQFAQRQVQGYYAPRVEGLAKYADALKQMLMDQGIHEDQIPSLEQFMPKEVAQQIEQEAAAQASAQEEAEPVPQGKIETTETGMKVEDRRRFGSVDSDAPTNGQGGQPS